MRTWGYSINSHPGHQLGVMTVYERPWWLAAIENFALWINWSWLHHIKLPNCGRIRDSSNGEFYTWREWYGSVGSVINLCVSDPIFQWVWHHPRNKRYDIELGYARTRELFYAHSPEFFDWEAGIGSSAATPEEEPA